MAERINITSPVGRVVMGSLYKPNTTDAEGKPLLVKNGANAGVARAEFFFALAIPKGAEKHWAETAWGQQIWVVGHTAFPQAAQSREFSWKLSDGDSQEPGKLWKGKPGKKPAENEGWPGHWVLKFKGGFAPKVYRPDGKGGYEQVAEEDYIKPGYYCQVAFNVSGNGSQTQPGVYLNHNLVCFSAYGPEINFGPNVEDAGFGQSPLPAGASAVPLAGAIPMPAGVAQPPAPALPPLLVTPNPQFLQVLPPTPNPTSVAAAAAAAPVIPWPNATVSPSNPPPPPVPVGPTMTAKAAGASYQAYIQAGWTDAQLVAQGYMTL